MDFITWFFVKHYIVAALLFPEMAFAWGVWMRWPVYAAVVGVYNAARWSMVLANAWLKKR